MSHFGERSDVEVTSRPLHNRRAVTVVETRSLTLRDKFRMAMEQCEMQEHQVAHETITAAVTGSMTRWRKNARNQRKAPGLGTTSNCDYGLGHLIGNMGLKFVKI